MVGPHSSDAADRERLPLLARSQSALSTVSHLSRQVRTWERSQRFTNLFILVVVLISFGDQLQETPQNRIFEAVICYRYYEKVDPSKILLDRQHVGPGAIGGVDELWCKADAVQADLVMLRGWQTFFDGIPSLLLAIPFGWAADRVGRKPLVTLGLLGLTLRIVWIQFATWYWQSFNIRAVWYSTLFTSIGGGVAMVATLAFVVLSDVTPEENRGGVFLRLGAFNLMANLVMPPFSAWLMRYTPWIPVMGGTGLQLLSVITFLFLQETLNFPMHGSKRLRSTADNPCPPPPPDLSPNQEPISLNTANQWFTNIRDSSTFLTEDWRVPVLIIPFLIHMLIGVSGQLIVQYLSARFALTFSQATLVATVRSAAVVVVLFVLLPALSTFLMSKLHLSHQRKDLYLARASQAFVAIGCFTFGLAPNIPSAAVMLAILSLGQGAPFLLRSFLTSLLPRDQIAIAYSVISLVDTLGTMLGGPFLAELMKKGFAMGGAWVGLPFLFTGLLAGLFTIILCFVGLRKGEDEQSVDDADDN